VSRAFCLVDLAFGLQLPVASDLASGFFDSTLSFVGSALHVFTPLFAPFDWNVNPTRMI
jgi:hypothetical protein